MFYVFCPLCLAKVEIPDDAVGTNRADPWNVIGCDDCGCTFDYDDEEVLREPENDEPPAN